MLSVLVTASCTRGPVFDDGIQVSVSGLSELCQQTTKRKKKEEEALSLFRNTIVCIPVERPFENVSLLQLNRAVLKCDTLLCSVFLFSFFPFFWHSLGDPNLANPCDLILLQVYRYICYIVSVLIYSVLFATRVLRVILTVKCKLLIGRV